MSASDRAAFLREEARRARESAETLLCARLASSARLLAGEFERAALEIESGVAS